LATELDFAGRTAAHSGAALVGYSARGFPGSLGRAMAERCPANNDVVLVRQ
jgi:hypothetical protein